jgi:hypothetical protein
MNEHVNKVWSSHRITSLKEGMLSYTDDCKSVGDYRFK